jgi:ATP-dependent protease ClpP protease subunit
MESEASTQIMGPMPKYFGNRAVQIHTEVLQKQVHHIYLNFEIVRPNAYSELLDILNNATEIDEIHIHINSEGGDGQTTLQVLNTMMNCRGFIITYAEGVVASAATMIFLAGHEMRVAKYVEFMVHAPSSYMGGKHNELLSSMKFCEKRWKARFKDIYGNGFMTQAEIKLCLEGKDFWMDADDLNQRLAKRQQRTMKELQKQGVDISGLLGG